MHKLLIISVISLVVFSYEGKLPAAVIRDVFEVGFHFGSSIPTTTHLNYTGVSHISYIYTYVHTRYILTETEIVIDA